MTVQLDRDYTFLVGTYTDLDALAHQPYAPTSGSGIYTLKIKRRITPASSDRRIESSGTYTS